MHEVEVEKEVRHAGFARAEDLEDATARGVADGVKDVVLIAETVGRWRVGARVGAQARVVCVGSCWEVVGVCGRAAGL